MVQPNVTTMVIKVDLQCHKCSKKIKKVLCKFPQIQDQVYDEKENTVTIKVVCCSPEKIKQKICCKGGECVKGIEIIVPKPPQGQKDQTSTEIINLKDQTSHKTDPQTPEKKPKKPELAPCYPAVLVPVVTFPIGVCCTECSEGRGGGPCYRGCGFPRPPPVEKPTEAAKPKETSKKPAEKDEECSEGRGGGPCYSGDGFPPPSAEKSTETVKLKEKPKKKEPDPSHSPPVPVAASSIGVCCTECSQGRGGGPCYRGCGFQPRPAPSHSPLVPVAASPIGVCCTECSEGRGGGPCYRGCGFQPPPAPSHSPLVPVAASPIGVCCTECSEGRGGGPCYRGYGYPPPSFYEGYCGRPVYDSGGCKYRDGYYVCEENGSACSIM